MFDWKLCRLVSEMSHPASFSQTKEGLGLPNRGIWLSLHASNELVSFSSSFIAGSGLTRQ